MTTSGHAPPEFATVLHVKLYAQGRGLRLTEVFRKSAAAFADNRPVFKGR